MEAKARSSRLDELIDRIPVLDRLAQQVQIDDVAAGARTAKQLGDAYDEWFTSCLLLLPSDLREKFRFEYEGSVRTLQYRIKHFLHEPVKPRPKFFGGRQKRPSEHQGLLSYWQHPYTDRFKGPLTTQKQLLLEARARLDQQASSAEALSYREVQEEPVPEPDRDRTVFVIHGRDKKARRALFDFLRAIGLQPLEWSQVLAEVRQGSPKIGDALQAVLGKGRAVIVLATPDDVVQLKAEHADDEHDPETQPAGQARPNVIYETGMAMMLIPERTILVELGKVRRFTDLDGHFVVRLNNDPAPRKLLAQRLSDVGCAVDLRGSDWLEAGDLTPPVVTTNTGVASTPPVTGLRQTGDDGVQLGNFTVTPDHKVYGEAHNTGSSPQHLVLKVTFYDANRRILGTGSGAVNDLAPQQTKTFTLTTSDAVGGYQDYKVEVESAF
ncbi:TIR domain-containing protein [Saccharothrix syringae]|uniref:CD-NTase-associated protein 12/Pycsar effector protein TIR domain-containing protein n=1 Tax=Saccharothrix syringae TaxID=103733 RepID=A0A5Q0GYH9_SACSY|nr:TIR domain-containing protein [Saccharothrix syringae]QFZ18432.1 hypothetical protein EKG83_13915 [Saccharothrix syringae]